MEKLPPLHSYVVFCHHIPLHIVLGGIHLGLLCEDKSRQQLDTLIHRSNDGFHSLFVDEFLRTSEHHSDVLVNAIQLGEVEPVKRGHQPQLILVGFLKGLAGDVPPRADLRRQLVVAQGGAAVIHARRPQPLQGVRAAEQPEVVEVPVLVGDEVVQYQHLVQGVRHIGDTQLFAAVAVVLIDGSLVVLLLGLHHPPGGDQFRVRGDEILTHAVREALVPQQGVGNVGDTQPVGHLVGNHLVKWLLLEGAAAGFH